MFTKNSKTYKNPCRFTGSRLLMGTTVELQLFGNDAERIAKMVFDNIQRLESLWSPYIEGSEIDDIYKCAGIEPLRVSDETFRVISLSRAFNYLSGGAFNITIAPLINLWKEAINKESLPSETEFFPVRDLTIKTRIHLSRENRSVSLTPEKSRLDLGAVGKGYAADCAAVQLRQSGIRFASINLGGNVLVVGTKPDNSAWKVGIRDPFDTKRCVGFIEAADCAVVTSGGYDRFFHSDIGRIHHIIDPRTFKPSQSDVASVTVIAKSSMIADILSTSVFILGITRGLDFIQSLKNVSAVFIDNQGSMYFTENAEAFFNPI